MRVQTVRCRREQVVPCIPHLEGDPVFHVHGLGEKPRPCRCIDHVAARVYGVQRHSAGQLFPDFLQSDATTSGGAVRRLEVQPFQGRRISERYSGVRVTSRFGDHPVGRGCVRRIGSPGRREKAQDGKTRATHRRGTYVVCNEELLRTSSRGKFVFEPEA